MSVTKLKERIIDDLKDLDRQKNQIAKEGKDMNAHIFIRGEIRALSNVLIHIEDLDLNV